MNRAQMIEKAAVAVVTARTDTPTDVARSVVDALLPQVTTVEELEALLVDVSARASVAVLVDGHNNAWTLFEDDRGDWYGMRLGDQDEPLAVQVRIPVGGIPHEFISPLTVVWQP